MKNESFYRFIRKYAMPKNWEVIKARFPDCESWTPQDQKYKIDEEMNEFLDATENVSNFATFIINSFSGELFTLCYETFIKNTLESELADVVLAKCTYLSIMQPLMIEPTLPLWYIEETIGNCLNLGNRINLKLHIKAKIRYNSLRKYW